MWWYAVPLSKRILKINVKDIHTNLNKEQVEHSTMIWSYLGEVHRYMKKRERLGLWGRKTDLVEAGGGG